MKLTYEIYGKKITIETENDDLDIEDMFDIMEKLLLAIGFQPESINKYLDIE